MFERSSEPRSMRHHLRLIAAAVLLSLVAGCIIVPAPVYERPHYDRYYWR